MLIGAGAGILATSRMLPHVFAGPINAYEGDMLVVIDGGVRRLLAGSNPYVLYNVPWTVPLPYGPWLWLPYVIPYALRFDPRILTLIAHLVVGATAVWAASVAMRSGHWFTSILLVSLAGVLLLHARIVEFHRIGHTPVYWPLLVVFCWLLSSGRWTAAAICMGSLIAARTTMLSLAPVFLLFLWVRRELTWVRIAALASAAVFPFVPFAIADRHSLWYAIYGSYVHIVKDVVWVSSNWAHNTIGLTGILLRHGLQRYVELTQAVLMSLVYVLSAVGLRRGSRPEPWMALALLVFCMTTLWPVIYVYFDVYVLITASLSSHVLVAHRHGSGLWRGFAGLVAVSALTVFLVAAIRPGASYVVDVGSPGAAGFTGGGFGQDLAVLDEGRSVVWIEGEVAKVRLPRAGWRGTTIRVVAKAYTPKGAPVQRVAAVLNGRVLGTASLSAGWQEVAFSAPRRVWFYGFNLLELRFTHAIAPADVREGPDKRRLSAAIDAIEFGR